MEWIKLIGIVIIVLGFMLKLDTVATVVIAGLATALVSGMSFVEFLSTIGKAFTNQRFVTLFIVTLPLVGLTERFGLKQRAVYLIGKMKGLTVGTFYTVYLFIRLVSGFFSIRLGGHPQFVSPLIAPMGEATVKTKKGKLTKEESDNIKAFAAANENFGNFFGQNTFAAAAGVLLIAGTLEELGYERNQTGIASTSIIVAVIALFVIAVYNYFFSKKFKEESYERGERK